MTTEIETTDTPDLDTALMQAQMEFPEIPKDQTNTYFNTRYSSLDAIVSKTRPALFKFGLLLTHDLEDTETGLRVTAVLKHTPTKQKKTNSLSCNVNRDAPQQMGSAITYLRRYTASPLLGITPDEDDDGNATKGQQSNGKTPEKKTTKRTTNKDQKQEPEKPAPAANFGLPPEWPNSTMPELEKWIDALGSAAAFQQANRLLFNDDSPIISMAEREPLNLRLHNRYHEKLVGKSDDIKAKAAPITQEIEQTWQKTQLDKEAAARF